MNVERIVCFVILITIVGNGIAQQTSDQVPVRFGLYRNSLQTVNPAYMGTDDRAAVVTGYQGYSGLRKNIRTFHLTGYSQISAKSNKPNKHFVGVSAYSDREGAFIRRSRAYVLYALHLPLSSNWLISAGGALGAVNYSVASSQLRPGGSSMAIDGNAGIQFSNGLNSIGLAMNQLFNQILQPLRFEIELQRHFNFYYLRVFNLSPSVEITALPWLRLVDRNSLIGASGQLLLKKQVGIGLNYGHKSTLAVMAGYQNINIESNGFIDIIFGFHIPIGVHGQLNSQQYEVGLKYHLKNNLDDVVTK